MRIIQINATYGYGSTGHIVEDLHNALLVAGHESYVFWASKCSESGKRDSRVTRIGNTLGHKIHALQWRICNNQGWNSFFSTRSLCRRLKELNPDIVHLHNLHSNYVNLGVLLDFLAEEKIAVAVTLHDCWLFTGHCMHFMQYGNCGKWRENQCKDCPAFDMKSKKETVTSLFCRKSELFSKVDTLGVIGVSDWILNCGRESLLQNAKLYRRIYNWIDGEIFAPRFGAAGVREKLGIKPGQHLILGVSQGWSEEKGIHEFQYLSEQLSDRAIVVLVGDPCGHKSTGNLRLIGFTDSASELAELYSAADVFVNPSRMETFGKVTAEALSCGTPVVAYNNTGTAELVNDTVGLLVPDGDMEAMYSAVCNILRNGKRCYSAQCREYATSRFSKEALLSQYISFYQELM